MLEKIIRKIQENHYLSTEENIYLFSLLDSMKTSEQKNIIKDIIFRGNNGIVYQELRYYQNDSEYDDLLQEAFLALYKSIEGYDYKTMNSFYSYAKKTIMYTVIQYLNYKKRLITIPRSFYKTHQKKSERELMIEKCSPLSLNSENEEHEELYETIESDENVELKVINVLMKDLLMESLEQLTEVEYFVISHRFGLNDCSILTLKEIGKLLNFDTNKVKYIETVALKKLREVINFPQTIRKTKKGEQD